MADPHMVEPLLAEAEGFTAADFPFDEELLSQLRDLDAAEAGGATPGYEEPVNDEDVYKMRELIREKPKDVIQYLEEEGVAKLGEFEVQDSVAFKAFGKETIMTTGAEHYEVDWESMWREQLSEYSRSAAGIGWTTKITMEAHVVNLRDAAAEGSKGLLHPLLKRYHARGCSAAVFALPAVQAVIHFKWTTWARQFLLYELFCYLAWLLGYTVFTLLFQQEDYTMTFWELMHDRNGFLATVFSLLTLLPMAPFLYMELCTIAAYGVGWVGMWNLMDLASYVLQVVICVLHLQRSFMDEGWFSVMIATQHVLMWTKLHYFAKAFNPTKTTLVDTISRILDDLKWFLVFLALTMVGFALAFYSLYRQDRDKFPDFANIWHSFASMYSYMLAMFDYNVFYSSTNPTAAMILFVIFEFMMNVLLLNVLIASMTNSFSKIAQDEGLRFLTSKAEIIDELETTLPKWVRSKSWYPPFVHILKLHPDSTYEVNLNSVWSGMGLMENNLLGAQQETRLRVEELEDKLSKVHKKLDVLIKLFISSMTPSHPIGLSRETTAAHGMPTSPGLNPAGLQPGSSNSPFAAHHSVSMGPTAGRRDGQRGGGFSGFASSVGAGAHTQGCTAPTAAVAGGAHLRHVLSQLPEALTAVSGPIGPLGAPTLGYPSLGYMATFAGLAPFPYAQPAYGFPGFGGVRPMAHRSMPATGLFQGRPDEGQAGTAGPDSSGSNAASSGTLDPCGSSPAAAAADAAGGLPPLGQSPLRCHSRRVSGEGARRGSGGEGGSGHAHLSRNVTTGHIGTAGHSPHAHAGVQAGAAWPTGSGFGGSMMHPLYHHPLPMAWYGSPVPGAGLGRGGSGSFGMGFGLRQPGRSAGPDYMQEGRQFLRQCMLARSHSL